jgi:UDP-4-amino-4-deoxy-L-arabinose-oxoglutarate aminotransferase
LITHSRPALDAADAAAVRTALDSGFIARGPRVALFEQRVCGYLGAKAALAASSGTAALSIALRAVGVRPGEDVIVPTYVCESVVTAVRTAGASPVFCDVGPDWNMTPASVSAVMTPKARAVVLVYIFGIAENASHFTELPIVEDCCQAFGATAGGRTLGTRGHAGVLSFHATKCLATGEGGMVVTSNEHVSAALSRMQCDGAAGAGMSDLQAALGVSQLDRYESFLTRRAQLAARYFDELGDLPITLPSNVRGRSLFFRFPVRMEGRSFDRVREAFSARGVAVRRGVDALLHRDAGLPDSAFPTATRLFNQTVSLPIYPALTDAEQSVVIEAARKVFA